MSNTVRITILLVVAGMICPSARAALWNPDGTDLTFNLNFENNTTSPNPTTTDAKASLVGRAEDYNSIDVNNPFHMWDSNAADRIIGNYVGDFRAPSDAEIGKDFDCRVIVGPNIPLSSPPYNTLFNLGTYLDPLQRTFTFWFNVSDLSKGSIFRHENVDPNYPNNYWEIKIYDGKLRFEHKLSILDMSTSQTLAEMGIQQNTWHHVAMTWDVYDESTRANNKIYIDGAEVDRVIDDYKYYLDSDIDTLYRSPVQFGAGEKEFDGLLDEFRVYNRVLTSSEISILYQTDYKPHPFALTPYPNISRVRVTTKLQWEPNMAGATAQSLYFGIDPCNFGAAKKTGNGAMNEANYTEINNGTLALGTIYYWDVNATVGGIVYQGLVWKFTTEDGKAYNPTPADSQQDVNTGALNLQWYGCPSAASYDVYFSNNQSLVAENNASALVKSGLVDADPNWGVSTTLSAENFYWRIVSKLDANLGYPDVNSGVWTFRTKPYPIVFNTDNNDVVYDGQVVPGYKCMIRDANYIWSTISTGRFDAYDIQDINDGLTIFFDFNGFSYNNRFDIIVLPTYGQEAEVNVIPTSLCIDVNGNFYFDGRMDISGENTSTTGDSVERDWPRARCGGYRGQPRNAPQGTPDSNFIARNTYDGRFSAGTDIRKYWVPEPNTAYKLYGPGMGITVSEAGKQGGGGGYGGIGGDSGRGYFHGVFAGGPTYGDKEVPVAFGGSAGGWGGEMWGGGGGGGIEIIANGNVTLDSNSIVRAEGGSVILPSGPVKYSAGGGAGGSVKVIAGGSATIKGVIDVNGGKGGDNSTTESGNAKPNNTSGGGGGGRVAIFYGTIYTNTGASITAKGGAKGVILPTASNGFNWNKSLAEDGQDGTIFDSNGSPRKASAPTPKNGDKMVYAPASPTALTLKWYSGYNVTSANDIVYFDQNPNPTTKVGEVPATRGQHGVSVNVNPNQTYYWRVKTKATTVDVNSDVWSFRTVGWKCLSPDANTADPGDLLRQGWPEWDVDHDCVVDMEDFWYFAKDWRVDRGGSTAGAYTYMLDLVDLSNYAVLWLECRGRTNNGCIGW